MKTKKIVSCFQKFFNRVKKNPKCDKRNLNKDVLEKTYLLFFDNDVNYFPKLDAAFRINEALNNFKASVKNTSVVKANNIARKSAPKQDSSSLDAKKTLRFSDNLLKSTNFNEQFIEERSKKKQAEGSVEDSVKK